ESQRVHGGYSDYSGVLVDELGDVVRLGDHDFLGLVRPQDGGFQLSEPVGRHLCNSVDVFGLGGKEVEQDSGDFLCRCAAEAGEQGYTPVLAHLCCVSREHYSSHSSIPQPHFALVSIRSLFRPVFPKTTCFRGAMYFKLVFNVNRKIINCSCSDTFQGRKQSFSPMRHREGRNSSETVQKVGCPAKKSLEFSRFSAELFQ